MNADRLLTVLIRAGARIGRTPDGRVIVAGAPPELDQAIADHGPELALGVAGQRSGHRWATCTDCHRPALIATGKEQPCRQTVRCNGKLKAYATARPEPGLGVPCARPGCTLEAVHLTASHEPLCSPDFLHLALTLDHRRTPQP